MGGNVIGGRYRLCERLGEGAMSEVWLADDEQLERPVALKLIAPDADRRRFEREARAAAALSDPNVERIYAYGEEEGRPYMVLEYLPGGSLEDRLTYGKPLRDADATGIAIQLASGLAHAHSRGLVHRDLKPANVLFDAEGRAKIADFGIARLAGVDTFTEEGTVIGTAGYISPEQAAGRPVSPASDVYAFGVILFRLLTGRLPFEGESAVEVAAMHRDRRSPAIESLRPNAPPQLAALATAAMAKDPRQRPPDGAALVAALGGGAAETAEETVVLPRPRRAPRVSRRAVAALTAAVALLTGGIVAAAVLTHGSGSGGSQTTPRTRAHPRRTTPTTTASATAPSTATSTTQSTTAPSAPTAPAPPPTVPTEPTTAPTTTQSTTTATTSTGATPTGPGPP